MLNHRTERLRPRSHSPLCFGPNGRIWVKEPPFLSFLFQHRIALGGGVIVCMSRT